MDFVVNESIKSKMTIFPSLWSSLAKLTELGYIFMRAIYHPVCVSSNLLALLSSFIPGRWQPCSRTCGAGTQQRTVKCQVLLSFSQTVADLPDDECEGVKPATSQPCYRTPCSGVLGKGKEREKEEEVEEERGPTPEREELHDWEYEGFTECSESCGGGMNHY